MKRFNIYAPLLVICFTLAAKAQNTRNEFGFVTDNDLYVSFFLDKYYTNGLELFFHSAAKKPIGNFSKRIRSIRVGQKMYNPDYFDTPYVYDQDRPYAGYVYANYSESFINKKHILTIGIESGFTGKKTMAREAQEFVHQFYDMQASEGWDTQIQEKFAFGLKAAYTRNLFHQPEKSVQLAFISNATLHQILANVSSGLGLKINLDKNNALTSIDKTSFYQTAVHSPNETWTRECFLGIKSYLTYQLKDYTVTGKLANTNDFIQKDFNTKPWVWHNDIGFYWNLKHWNISYHQIIHTANVSELRTGWVRYGSIALSYKF